MTDLVSATWRGQTLYSSDSRFEKVGVPFEGVFVSGPHRVFTITRTGDRLFDNIYAAIVGIFFEENLELFVLPTDLEIGRVPPEGSSVDITPKQLFSTFGRNFVDHQTSEVVDLSTWEDKTGLVTFYLRNN